MLGGTILDSKNFSLETSKFSDLDSKKVNLLLNEQLENDNSKIIVLDDDPTGVQTVHDISVYTDWNMETIREGFLEKNKIFYILTNSRGFIVEETTKAHTEIAENIDRVGKELGIDYFIISRGDSTLRGHYPLETELLKNIIEKNNSYKIDGEIICPFFKEGGRYTIDNVHYVKYGDELVPAGETEFAKDKTFGYNASDLCEYVEEKTEGRFKADNVVSISLESLRNMDINGIVKQLETVTDFNKIIVNAIDDLDLKVFCIALYKSMKNGKHFVFRTAAAFVKAIGNISNKPLLSKDDMITINKENGGIVVVGSHTKKTTMQLEELKKIPNIVSIEMNSDLVLEEDKLEKEVETIVSSSEKLISEGKTVVVYTKRALLVIENDTKEDALIRSVKISNAVQSLVGNLKVSPSFVVAKGGITSSDVGTKALRVKKARVMGQIKPGIPVWETDERSKFPNIPYIIFPGNVGEVETLKEAVEVLIGV
ncbi:MAG: four-carbon acid sugar kinase family protein [Lachnospirales bacterium]